MEKFNKVWEIADEFYPNQTSLESAEKILGIYNIIVMR